MTRNSFDIHMINYIESAIRTLKAQPLYLGNRAGGYIGTLPQEKVTYDPVESDSNTVPQNPTLKTNLNRIRHRLSDIESKLVPSGGFLGEVLGKLSDTSYDVGWITQSGAGGNPGGESLSLQFNDGGTFNGTIIEYIEEYEDATLKNRTDSGALKLVAGVGVSGVGGTLVAQGGKSDFDEGGAVELTAGSGVMGGAIRVTGGAGRESFGGDITITGGGSLEDSGGDIIIGGGDGDDEGGSVIIQAGKGTLGGGGSVVLKCGTGAGNGSLILYPSQEDYYVELSSNTLTGDITLDFQDKSGTIALLDDIVSVSGVPEHISIFDGGGNLSSTDELMWDTTYKILSIGLVDPIVHDAGSYASLRQTSEGGGVSNFLTTYSDTTASFITGIRTRGTRISPSAVKNNDALFRIRGWGHDGTALSSSRTAIYMVADEDWDTSHHGTRLEFHTTPKATTTLALAASLDGDGNLDIKSGGKYKVGGSNLIATATDLGGASPSDLVAPSQKAAKTYIDAKSAEWDERSETLYAAVANGVTNGDSHDHNGGDGAQIAHGNLSGIGTNTHAQIDAHIASVANPHNVTAVQAGAQPVDAGLTSLSAFPTVADRIVYSTAADTWAETPLTAAVRTLLDDATVAAMRTTLNAAGLADANDFTATQTVKVADNTKAIVLTDDSDVEWLSIKRVGNTVTLDVPSVEPVNKLINPTFDTDLSSWSEIMSYILNDQFTTDRAAGAVNGTSAEPTGGTRTVTDTNSKLSITGSQLSFATGGSAAGNPGLLYSVVTRGAGKVLTGTLTVSAGQASLGWDSNTSGGLYDALLFSGADLFIEIATGSIGGGSVVAGTTYQVAYVMRSTGQYYFIKGGTYTNWTLIYVSSTGSGNLYPGVIVDNTTGVATADNIRIPTSTWLPTPLAYDTFTRADGAIGSSETTGPDGQTTPSLAWTGGAISNNKLVITPTLGSELVVNGGFDADTNWTKGTGWAISGGTGNVVTGATWADLWQNQSLLVGGVYQKSVDYNIASGQISGVTSSGNKITTFRATTTNSQTYVVFQNGAGVGSYVDNVSLKPLTLSSLFSSVSTSDTDVIADANVTLTAGTQAGLVTNLDSTSSPANFLIAYHDGTYVKLDKNVGGTYTNLISDAATYSAGATLRVITYTSSGSLKVRVYYNNALVGGEQTVSDAGIISNTKHGLFSTYSGNSFDNFTLWARGTGAEYTSAPFEELTVTRDTTTKYEGAASAKLVAGGTDGNYLQSVNVGDTATYNLYCYAYTTGAAVTSADVELYYDGAVLSTSYTDMGGGWYKLSSSLTGVASAKDFGVRVKAGKTVYCDSFSLQAGSGATTILKILNGGTGLLLLQLADGLPEYADNAAAVAAGLAVGVTYRTGDVVKIVH